MTNRECLFSSSSERSFKQQFTIQFMAALEAKNYQDNCTRGWHGHRIAVEDAAFMAEKAWEEWVDTIGVEDE